MEHAADAGTSSSEPPSGNQSSSFIELFDDYAKAARGTAIKNRSKGDAFGEKLANARADVYKDAAELARQYPLDHAAQLMMKNARGSYVRTPPLTDFDRAGLDYMRARAWQFCALKIDPALPPVAPPWD